MQSKKIAYVAEAEVHHSHEPNLTSQWERYRSIGRFYAENHWLQENFGGSTGEGLKLVRYQLQRIGTEKGIWGLGKVLALDAIKLDAIKFIAYKTS